MTSEWVYDLRGKEVVFTGKFDGYVKAELAKIAGDLGARNVSGWVNNSSTDVLIRGWNAQWKYGDYGEREEQVAKMQAYGHRILLIDEAGFHGLRSGVAAPALKPHSPRAIVRAAAAEGGVVGAPYRAGSFAGPVQGDGEHYRDPDIMERGLKAHSSTQDKLAELIRLHGLTPLSPFDKTCNFDLAWEREDGSVGVAEVKSITEGNEAFQVRHGLGQVLDYGRRLTDRGFQPKLFLVLEAKPKDVAHWKPLCAEHRVTLTWAPFFPGVV
jgi:hypothetical protein